MKPLGTRAYGSIPHLPGSRRGPADKGLSEDQARILTTKTRDKHDTVIVQEKLDGTCCAVARLHGSLLAINRAGYMATSSPRFNHKLFADWVKLNEFRFSRLEEGERVVGEWMAQTHGTKYPTEDPFVAFDIMVGTERKCYTELVGRLSPWLALPRVLHIGGACSVEQAMKELKSLSQFDEPEGAVWRVERKEKVDFLGKYVRPEKVDGCYLPERNNGLSMFNWLPNPLAH